VATHKVPHPGGGVLRYEKGVPDLRYYGQGGAALNLKPPPPPPPPAEGVRRCREIHSAAVTEGVLFESKQQTEVEDARGVGPTCHWYSSGRAL
jgi:hypothetical protein